MAYKTVYKPTNKDKYVGNSDNIVCRSLWERKFCKYLDQNNNVVRWSSEEIAVPYYSPIDNKTHNYYPDFVFEVKCNTGIKTMMVEIKPEKQTHPPKNKKGRTALEAALIFEINTAKWEAAKRFCDKNHWEFKILTEKNLFKG
jgi:hypothetical protein